MKACSNCQRVRSHSFVWSPILQSVASAPRSLARKDDAFLVSVGAFVVDP